MQGYIEAIRNAQQSHLESIVNHAIQDTDVYQFTELFLKMIDYVISRDVKIQDIPNIKYKLYKM
ncbi:hypothetical protein IMG5_117020 [Ichthyophthirius multifiliis]|uniref:Uncharacterized protein n=1 Tax=Ichthyophthirius multifiliis TaxID=5932 RepID=G0QUG7_ICHMU|nr:hypothetical protein IMG5_117020 [Ichthyophthirius multifiliis]EGR31137.1 hypothetical protein IMG5_117020 [Ichthyophthirius multifiliis]|eukprot:XP_004034623.1 hypothetical protein IMG5_117020 [Ichthyophthirius multifiliis]